MDPGANAVLPPAVGEARASAALARRIAWVRFAVVALCITSYYLLEPGAPPLTSAAGLVLLGSLSATGLVALLPTQRLPWLHSREVAFGSDVALVSALLWVMGADTPFGPLAALTVASMERRHGVAPALALTVALTGVFAALALLKLPLSPIVLQMLLINLGLLWLLLFISVILDRSRALAERNTALLRESTRRAERLRVLQTLSGLVVAETEPGKMLDTIAGVLPRLFPASVISIHLWNQEGGDLRTVKYHGWEVSPEALQGLDRRLGGGEGIIGWVARTRQPYRTGDVSSDPHHLPGPPGTRSEMAAPLLFGRELLGVFNVETEIPHAFTPEDEEILMSVADSMSVALQHARSLEQTGLRVEAVSTLQRLSQAMMVHVEPEEVMLAASEGARTLVQAETAALVMLQEDGSLRYEAAVGDHAALLRDRQVLPGGIQDLVIREGRPILTNNPLGDGFAVHDISLEMGFRSLLSVPLIIGGEVRGCLTAFNRRSRPFNEEEFSLLTIFANQVYRSLEHAFLYKQLQALADTDPLTGLRNHRVVVEQVEREVLRAKRTGRGFSVLMIDIDNFKRVNDTYGHQVGDAVLRLVAERLTASVRASDLVGRYGGEEFLLVFPETDDEGAAIAAERIHKGVTGPPFEPPGVPPLRISLSIGVAYYPQDASEANLLIAAADAAQYRAKGAGGGRTSLARETAATPSP